MFLHLKGLICFVAAAAAVDVNNIQQLEAAKKSNDKTIVLKNIQVPAGQSLDLMNNLKPGTTIIFAGRITFGYKEWKGSLIQIKGKNIRVEGRPGHVIDCEGARWWDFKGGPGKPKPGAVYVQLEDSFVTGLYVKNPPMTTFAVNGCKNTELTKITVDVKDGHTRGALNTDGFGVRASSNVKITHSYVNNQDDCLALQANTNDITFENNVCEGGHGIGIIGGYGEGPVRNIFVRNCKVIKNNVGVRVKTIRGSKGIVDNVHFEDVELKDISFAGIWLMGNYHGGGPVGEPTLGCPIKNLFIKNVHGNVLKNATNIRIEIADDPGNTGWMWDSKVVGGTNKFNCKGVPKNMKFQCG